jgi:hypothetical protein
MNDPRVTIDEIVLRVPNLSEEDARRMGQEVALRLGDALGRLLDRNPVEIELGMIDLRMTIKDPTSREDLGRAITERIIASLLPALHGGQRR